MIGGGIPITQIMEQLRAAGGGLQQPDLMQSDGGRTYELPIDPNSADMGPGGIAGPAYDEWARGLGVGPSADQPAYPMKGFDPSMVDDPNRFIKDPWRNEQAMADAKIPVGPVTLAPGEGGLWHLDGGAQGMPATDLLTQLRTRFGAPTAPAAGSARNSNGGLVARNINAARPNGIGTIASRLAQDPSRSVGVGALMGGGGAIRSLFGR